VEREDEQRKAKERMSKEKGKRKKDVAKRKRKTPAYKLQSDIESSIDLKGILEERILDTKIEFTLREALGIAKKDFHELIIDIIKRKRQMTAKTVMTRTMNTCMTEDEEKEIGQVFALMCDCVDGQDKGNETISSQVYEESSEEMDEFLDDEMESEILQMFSYGCVDKIRMEPRTNKNQQDEEIQASNTQKDIIIVESTCEVPNTEGPIMEANVSCCMTY
jgi:hypothetical protein